MKLTGIITARLCRFQNINAKCIHIVFSCRIIIYLKFRINTGNVTIAGEFSVTS